MCATCDESDGGDSNNADGGNDDGVVTWMVMSGG